MGSKTRPTEAAADIDGALKALFDALAGAPTPPTILSLIDQLEQGDIARAAESNAACDVAGAAKQINRRAS